MTAGLVNGELAGLVTVDKSFDFLDSQVFFLNVKSRLGQIVTWSLSVPKFCCGVGVLE